MDILQTLTAPGWFIFLGGFGICFLFFTFVYQMGSLYESWKRTKLESFGGFKREIQTHVDSMRAIEGKICGDFEDFKKATIERHTDYLNMLERDTKEIGERATGILDDQRGLLDDLDERLSKVEKELKTVNRSPAVVGLKKKPGRPNKGLKK